MRAQLFYPFGQHIGYGSVPLGRHMLVGPLPSLHTGQNILIHPVPLPPLICFSSVFVIFLIILIFIWLDIKIIIILLIVIYF